MHAELIAAGSDPTTSGNPLANRVSYQKGRNPHGSMAKLPPDVLEFFRKEGQKGGKATAKKLSPEQRRERAQKAAAKSAEVRSKKKTAPKKENRQR
jgi:hypothetical protein